MPKKFRRIRLAKKPQNRPFKSTGKARKPPMPVTAEPEMPEEAKAESTSGGGKEHSEPQESQEQEAPQEAEGQEQAQAQEGEAQEAPQEEVVVSGEPIYFPLISSHYANGKVRSATVCITSDGCSVLHCDESPRNVPNIGAEHIPTIMRAHRTILRKKGLFERQRRMAEQLVIRAREGDQNAMAILALTRANAQKGYPPAVSAFKLMMTYAKNNPVGASFGAESYESIEPDTHASIALANGPPISYSGINRICISFGAERNRQLFAHGVKTWNDHVKHRQLSGRLTESQRNALRLGRTIGKAKALQMIRSNASLSTYDPMVGWEHGE